MNEHVEFFRKVVAVQLAAGIDAPHMHGIVQYVERLESALRGLLTFRDDKDEWDRLTDSEIKRALDAAYSSARDALGL